MITALVGPTGSGKSRRLIQRATEAAGQGRAVATFVSSEYPWPQEHGAFWVRRLLVCGEPGLTYPINHFASAAEVAAIIPTLPNDAVIAIEEAYTFGPAIIEPLRVASARGVEIVLAAPSPEQKEGLKGAEYHEEVFTKKCDSCGINEASISTIRAEDGKTEALCESCFALGVDEARRQIIIDLREQDPFPGEDALYQPVDFPEFAEWRLARPDTPLRAKVVLDTALELGVVPGVAGRLPTYLDVGCNTGFFCDYFASHGFVAKGVDATHRFIRSARLLEWFFLHPGRPGGQFVRYEQANAYEYLRDTQQERFDVTSAFAVLQWVMIQRGVEQGLECLGWLAEKARVVCFVEMGYTREEMYRGKLDVEIDRPWVERAMHERGKFSEVRVISASPGGLQRDLFIGIK